MFRHNRDTTNGKKLEGMTVSHSILSSEGRERIEIKYIPTQEAESTYLLFF